MVETVVVAHVMMLHPCGFCDNHALNIALGETAIFTAICMLLLGLSAAFSISVYLIAHVKLPEIKLHTNTMHILAQYQHHSFITTHIHTHTHIYIYIYI